MTRIHATPEDAKAAQRANARSRGNWATAASNLAARITDETNHRHALEERVARLEDRQRAQTGTGPRLGVPIGRSGGQGQGRLRSVPGAAEGRMR